MPKFPSHLEKITLINVAKLLKKALLKINFSFFPLAQSLKTNNLLEQKHLLYID